MASLTTLFVVGPEEYVEFSESMGSKAFVEHIWDQSRTPLKMEDTSASGSQLHSAGARISPAPPPRIEFPTILRLRGRGNKYKPSGRFISWEELKRRNPIALKDPPSLDEFIKQGSQVGTAERLEPGAFLKGEKRFKLNKKQKGTIEVHESQDGWIGGSTESIYATKPTTGGSTESIYAPKPQQGGSSESVYAVKSVPSKGSNDKQLSTGGSSDSIYAPKATSLSVDKSTLSQTSMEVPRTLRKSRSGLSLSARLGIDASTEEAERQNDEGSSSSDESTKKHSKIQQRPSRLTLPGNRISLLAGNESDSKTPIAQTPLSATHSPPETPLKRHANKGRMEIPPTPNTQERFSQEESGIQMKAGLMLDPGHSQTLTPTLSEPPAVSLVESIPVRKTAPPARAARNQMDEMLARLRQARSAFSGGDSSESMWAPKKIQEDSSLTPTPTRMKESNSSGSDHTLTKEVHSKNDLGKASTVPSKPVEDAKPVPIPEKQDESIGKSLFDRLGPKVDETGLNIRQNEKSSKKERKRGGRTHTHEDHELSSRKEIHGTAPSSSSSAVKETKFDGDNKTTEIVEPEKAVEHCFIPVKEEERESAPIKNIVDPNPALAHETTDEEPAKDLNEDRQSKESQEKIEAIPHFGNDTFASFDWADDDDESLPELTEEWMKVALLSSPVKAEQTKSMTGDSEIGERIKSKSNLDNDTSTDTHDQKSAKRERKGRAGKREKDRGAEEKDLSKSKDFGQSVHSGQGIRIAGSASRQLPHEPKSLSSVPPWQRRSVATSPPKEPLGLRIAGRATESHSKDERFSDKSKHQSKEAHKSKRMVSSSSTISNRGRGFGSVMPPNATPLHVDGHPFLSKDESNLHNPNGRSRARGGRSNRRGSHGTDS